MGCGRLQSACVLECFSVLMVTGGDVYMKLAMQVVNRVLRYGRAAGKPADMRMISVYSAHSRPTRPSVGASTASYSKEGSRTGPPSHSTSSQIISSLQPPSRQILSRQLYFKQHPLFQHRHFKFLGSSP